MKKLKNVPFVGNTGHCSAGDRLNRLSRASFGQRTVGSARFSSMYAVNRVVLRVTRNHVLKVPFVSSSISIEAGSRIFNSSFEGVDDRNNEDTLRFEGMWTWRLEVSFAGVRPPLTETSGLECPDIFTET